MTISSTVRIAGPFIGTGTATVFPFAFKVFTASNLQVVRADSSTGLESTLILNTDYTVSLNTDQDSNPGGNVTLIAVLATGFTMVITSDIANLQPTDLTNQGGFYPEVITDAFDRATIQIQQMADELTRSIKIPISDGLSLDMELPTAAARANSFLAFDATGEPTVVTAGSPGSPTSITRQQFSGTGSQVAFTLASNPGALGNSCEVFIGGIYQQRDTYTIAGTTLTFSAAPVAGTDNIEVVNFLTSAIGTTDSSLVTYIPAGTGATMRTAQAKMRDTVSVKDFGAVGDGITDDAAAIQTAINATKNGSILLFPAGTYLCNSGLVLGRGSKLQGANTAMPDYRTINQNVTKLSFAGGVSAITVDQADIESGYVWGISIENMFIEGVAGNNGATGIFLRKAANARLKNVGIEQFVTGLKVTFGMFNTFDSCAIQRCGTTSILMSDEDGVTTTTRFVDCIFRESNWGIVHTSSGSYSLGTVFDHCTIESTIVGGANIHKGCQVEFIECYFENVPNAASVSGIAIKLYEDGTSSLTATNSVCNIIGGVIGGPNIGGPFTNTIVYVGSGAAAVNIVASQFNRGLYGVEVHASSVAKVVNAEGFTTNSVTNIYSGLTSQRRGNWPQAVLSGSNAGINFSGYFGDTLRTDNNTLEIRSSANTAYYTKHDATTGAAQSVSAIGAGGTSTSYLYNTQLSGSLNEVGRFGTTGYFKATGNAGSYAVPNFITNGNDAGHAFVANATINSLTVANLSTNAAAHCLLTTKPDIVNGNHITARRTDGVSPSAVFVVAANGNVTNTGGSYGAISDIKLKQDIVDCSPKLNKLLKVRVVNYAFVSNPSDKQIGVIAQELETISPSLVETTPDYEAVTKTRTNNNGEIEQYIEQEATGEFTKHVKYSVFVPMLIKAIQEQQSLIVELSARVDVLSKP